MGTYNHKQVLKDYASGRITAEMAVGHSLQHIDQLYEAQTATNNKQAVLQDKAENIEKRLNLLQGQVNRLMALLNKLPPNLQ